MSMARYRNWSKLRNDRSLWSRLGRRMTRTEPRQRGAVCAVAVRASVAWAATFETPGGTELHVRLKTKVSTTASKAKDPVEAEVIAPVVLNGQFLIPAGTIIHGAV